MGMFHYGSDTGYTGGSIEHYSLAVEPPYGSIHCAIDAFASRTEISLIPITYYSGNTEIDLLIMDICFCYG